MRFSQCNENLTEPMARHAYLLHYTCHCDGMADFSDFLTQLLPSGT